METTMFRDEEDDIKAEIAALLKVTPIEDLLDEMDLTPEEAVYYLYVNGYVVLPEVRPL